MRARVSLIRRLGPNCALARRGADRSQNGSTLAALEQTIREGCVAHDDWATQASRSLHKTEFWEKFYESKHGTSQADDFEWFVDASAAGRFVLDTIGPSHQKMLHVGAGTSNLGPFLLSEKSGIDVVNCDVSETAMKLMREAFPDHAWHVLDLAGLDLNPHPWDRSFDLIVDKGALDAVLFGGPELSANFLFGCARMLRQGLLSGGNAAMWIQISDDPPERRLGLLRRVLPEKWRVRYQPVRVPVDLPHSLFDQEHWGYVITIGE